MRTYILAMTLVFVAQAGVASSGAAVDERALYEESAKQHSVFHDFERTEKNDDKAGQQAVITATPHPCYVAAGHFCQSTVQWSYNQFPVSVYIVNPVTGVGSVVTTTAANGSINVPWISQWPGHHWELRYGGNAVAEVRNVYGRHQAFSATAGGSNYNWYHVDPGNDFISYGIVARYHRAGVRSTVQGQLAQMWQGGQRELRYMIHFCRTCDGTQTYLNSALKADSQGEHYLSRQAAANLAAFIQDVHSTGFGRIHLAMGAGSFNLLNEYCQGMSQQEIDSYAEENWGITRDVIAVAEASGVDYLIDLYNEGIPNTFSSQECFKDYLRDTWDKYVLEYSLTDTVGFSVIVGSEWDAYNRLALIDTIYRGQHPAVIQIHSYASEGSVDGRNALRAANEVLQNLLPASYANIKWIIGETHYNDAMLAIGLRNGALDTDNKLLYVLQWPVKRNDEWIVPLTYDRYLGAIDIIYMDDFESQR